MIKHLYNYKLLFYLVLTAFLLWEKISIIIPMLQMKQRPQSSLSFTHLAIVSYVKFQSIAVLLKLDCAHEFPGELGQMQVLLQ